MNKRSAEETKKRILASARTVFVEEGYAQASMRQIARASGISVGALYLHFKNKEKLYLTFVQEWMEQLNGETREALLDMDDPMEAMRAFIIITIEFVRRNREIIILQGRELGFHFGIELKREFFRERRGVIADIVRRGLAKGVFRECDADEAAKVIFNTLRGFGVSMVLDEDAMFASEACVDMVLHGLLRRNIR
ncbi:MAG TPA: TetR/AcrR family transcriptional regulator [Geobacteraceae bacterium]|nr:TetR/AcrR family transcriptional regulator [Geobacteraceae bacterium]